MSNPIEQAVEQDVKAVEQKTESVVDSVENEVKTVAEDIYSGAKHFETVVENEAKKVKDVLTAEEKLVLRNIEMTFIKAQAEAQAAVQKVEQAQKDFTAKLQAFVTKYVIDPSVHTFDVAEQVFKTIEAKL